MDVDEKKSNESERLLQDNGEKDLLRIHRKLAYAAGNFITVLAISLWFPYNILFFHKVLKLSPKNAGYIVLLGQAGGAISTPFIGMWSDQCNCRVPGRRKIFHLIGIISTSTIFFFLWYKCLGCTAVDQPFKVLYYGSFAIIFQFGWAATQIGQLALMPELTSEKKTLVELNSLRYELTLGTRTVEPRNVDTFGTMQAKMSSIIYIGGVHFSGILLLQWVLMLSSSSLLCCTCLCRPKAYL